MSDTAHDPTLDELLRRASATAASVIYAVPDLEAASACTGWTITDLLTHLNGALSYFAKVAEGSAHAELDEGHRDTDVARAFQTAAERCTSAFRRPGVLERELNFATGPTSGAVIANIALSEILVHGWDVATGAGLPYQPDEQVVAAVRAFQLGGEGPTQLPEDMFAPALPARPDDEPFTALLRALGRNA